MRKTCSLLIVSSLFLMIGTHAAAKSNPVSSRTKPAEQPVHITRNLHVDSWVATDALGRKLPSFEECGPVKKDRFVGMFYFMTHTSPGGKGPFDVTKIMKASPENPQWGEGGHFWGEPETGYYLSYEKWMIRRHAQMLADAGVDVII
ncbi:MAG TPA: hypothetical protein VN249_03835, partial [Prolixibacteraceae bacterium]|nr:hypothetical protein [Prolixibacteraceae bacterium]